MTNAQQQADFYAPNTKEIALGICFVLEQAGGCLSGARVVELVAEHFQIPESARRNVTLSGTDWAHFCALSTSYLRNDGFVHRNTRQTRGMCILTEHGRELGQWAKRIYSGENPPLPGWAAAFLKPTRKRIKNFLTGGKRRGPPDYELCRWVRYCYVLNWSEQGVALFSRVLQENVEPTLYRQAERQARSMQQRLDERPAEPTKPLPLDPKIRKEIPKVRKLVRDRFPVGARIPTLAGDAYHEIQGYKRAGIRVVTGAPMPERLLQWEYFAIHYLSLLWGGELNLQSLNADTDFVCALSAKLTGAVVDMEKLVLRLEKGQSWKPC